MRHGRLNTARKLVVSTCLTHVNTHSAVFKRSDSSLPHLQPQAILVVFSLQILPPCNTTKPRPFIRIQVDPNQFTSINYLKIRNSKPCKCHIDDKRDLISTAILRSRAESTLTTKKVSLSMRHHCEKI